MSRMTLRCFTQALMFALLCAGFKVACFDSDHTPSSSRDTSLGSHTTATPAPHGTSTTPISRATTGIPSLAHTDAPAAVARTPSAPDLRMTSPKKVAWPAKDEAPKQGAAGLPCKVQRKGRFVVLEYLDVVTAARAATLAAVAATGAYACGHAGTAHRMPSCLSSVIARMQVQRLPTGTCTPTGTCLHVCVCTYVCVRAGEHDNGLGAAEAAARSILEHAVLSHGTTNSTTSTHTRSHPPSTAPLLSTGLQPHSLDSSPTSQQHTHSEGAQGSAAAVAPAAAVSYAIQSSDYDAAATAAVAAAAVLEHAVSSAVEQVLVQAVMTASQSPSEGTLTTVPSCAASVVSDDSEHGLHSTLHTLSAALAQHGVSVEPGPLHITSMAPAPDAPVSATASDAAARDAPGSSGSTTGSAARAATPKVYRKGRFAIQEVASPPRRDSTADVTALLPAPATATSTTSVGSATSSIMLPTPTTSGSDTHSLHTPSTIGGSTGPVGSSQGQQGLGAFHTPDRLVPTVSSPAPPAPIKAPRGERALSPCSSCGSCENLATPFATALLDHSHSTGAQTGCSDHGRLREVQSAAQLQQLSAPVSAQPRTGFAAEPCGRPSSSEAASCASAASFAAWATLGSGALGSPRALATPLTATLGSGALGSPRALATPLTEFPFAPLAPIKTTSLAQTHTPSYMATRFQQPLPTFASEPMPRPTSVSGLLPPQVSTRGQQQQVATTTALSADTQRSASPAVVTSPQHSTGAAGQSRRRVGRFTIVTDNP